MQRLNGTDGNQGEESAAVAACCQSEYQYIVAASFLNNSAVGWMYSGESPLAYQLLFAAVRQQRAEAETNPTSGATSTCGMTLYPTLNNDEISRPLPVFVSCSIPVPKRIYQEKSSFELFERPLIVDTTLALEKRCYDIAAAAILYNLAFLYQQEGIKYGKSIHFEQADRFYASAFDLISTTISCEVCNELEVSLMLLAIWNNRAHIRCYFLVDFLAAQSFIDQMKNLLQKHTAGGSMLLSDYPVFVLNTLVHENGLVVKTSPAA